MILPRWILCSIFNLFTSLFNKIDVDIDNRAKSNKKIPIKTEDIIISLHIKLLKLQLLIRNIQL